jgi:hypothetical protein
MAVVLPPEVRLHSTIMHGLYPVTPFLEITRMEGAVVYELDGRPALDVLAEMIGARVRDIRLDPSTWFLALGQKHGDPYAPYDESQYVSRIIIDTSGADGSVTLYEADFSQGARVQVMTHDHATVEASVVDRTKRLVESLGGRRPVFGLYIDCGGRASVISGAEVEEAALMRQILGNDIPLLGFYSGVEIAPLLDRSRPLDWTGVLTLFTVGDEP